MWQEVLQHEIFKLVLRTYSDVFDQVFQGVKRLVCQIKPSLMGNKCSRIAVINLCTCACVYLTNSDKKLLIDVKIT